MQKLFLLKISKYDYYNILDLDRNEECIGYFSSLRISLITQFRSQNCLTETNEVII